MSALLALAFAAGMVAPVNPCGFALLPGWMALTAGDTATTPRGRRVLAVSRSAAGLTVGFVGTLVGVGLVVSAGARAIVSAAPQIGLATGVLLLALAVFSLAGRNLKLRLPQRLSAGRNRSGVHSLAYGIGFAAASLSCTFGVLLAVIAQAQSTATWVGQLLVFAVYAAGAATVLLLLAAATAVLGAGLSKPAARLARHGNQLTALILGLTGAYLTWYWYAAATDSGTTAGRGTVSSLAAPTATWVQSHSAAIAISAAVLLLIALVVSLLRRRRHPATNTAHHTGARGPVS